MAYSSPQGHAPGTDPAVDVGNGKSLDVANRQVWYGYARGTLLAGGFATLLAANSTNGNAAPLTIGAEFIALTLDSSCIATPNFYNRDKNDPTRMPSANLVPMPQGSNDPVDQTRQGRDELFKALTNWVENGVAPGSIEVASLDGSVRMPLCVHPARIAVKAGAAGLKSAASYECK